ncbi:MAG: hypothetical protein ACOYN6_03860 [Ignavibacteria bacterium]
MITKLITYTLIFSFLLTASGCYTTKYYSDPPEVFIAKEKVNNDVKYENINGLTLINKKTISLSDYTSRFIKSYMDSSYKFVYSGKSLARDTIDIRNISLVHYNMSKYDETKSFTIVGLSILAPFVLLGIVLLLMPKMHD